MLCLTAAYLSFNSKTKYTHSGVFEDWADFHLRKCTKYYCVAAEYYSNYIVDNTHAKRWDKISAIMKESKNKNKKTTFPVVLWTLFPRPVSYHQPKSNDLWVSCLAAGWAAARSLEQLAHRRLAVARLWRSISHSVCSKKQHCNKDWLFPPKLAV